MGLPTPFNPYQPIPNTPFYGVQQYFLTGWQGPLVIGAGLNVNLSNSTLNTSGGGGGSVGQIIAGAGISITPSSGVGNVVVTNTGVTALVAGTGVAITSGGGGSFTIAATGGAGTVTLVNSGSGLTGGPITTSGTLALDYACVVDPTDYNAKGAVLAGTGVGTYSALAVGANGTVLTACSACVNGAYWGSSDPTAIPCSAITGKGALITGTAASTVFSLGVGTDGQVLTACSAAGSGLCWAAAGGGIVAATPLVAGTVLGCTQDTIPYNTGLGVGVLGTPGASSGGNVAIGPYSMAVSNNALGNVGLGSGALCTITDGQFNVGAGFLALSAITTGGNNVAIGNSSGSALTTECFNVVVGGNVGAVGLNCQVIISDGQGTLRAQINAAGALSFDGSTYGTAGQVLTSGGAASTPTWVTSGAVPTPATPAAQGLVLGCTTASLTALGCFAGDSITTSPNNVAIGCDALISQVGGAGRNTAIGAGAASSLTGPNNTMVGFSAAAAATTASSTIAIGDSALGGAGPITGTANVGIGNNSLFDLTSGACNTAIGEAAGCNVTTGASNIAVGSTALGFGSGAVTGNCNIGIGTSSASGLTSGIANIVIGSGSHAGLGSGGCNIAIGGLNNVPVGSTCFTTIIGNGMTATQSCQVMIGWAGGGTCATFVQGSVGWTVSSDARMKDKVEDLDAGLEVVEKLQPRTYDFIGGIEEGEEGTPAFGLIAQEVAAAIEGTSLEGRGLVGGTEESGYGLAYAQLTVLLINAVKELSARVKELEAK
jgi:hypothetical protein